MLTLNKKMMSFLYFLVLSFCVIIVKGQAGTIRLQMLNGMSDEYGIDYTVGGFRVDNTEVYQTFIKHLRNRDITSERVTYATDSCPIADTAYIHVGIIPSIFDPMPKIYCRVLLHDNNTASLSAMHSTEECQLIHPGLDLYTLYIAPPSQSMH